MNDKLVFGRRFFTKQAGNLTMDIKGALIIGTVKIKAPVARGKRSAEELAIFINVIGIAGYFTVVGDGIFFTKLLPAGELQWLPCFSGNFLYHEEMFLGIINLLN